MNKYLSPQLLFRILTLAVVCLLLGGLAISAASANGVSSYSVSWYTFDGGGGVSSSPAYTVMGTIGQPDAGPQNTSPTYSLTGGFWAWVAQYFNFAPLIRKP